MAAGEVLQVEVRIDQAGPRPPAQPNHASSTAGGRTRALPNRQDSSIDSRRHLGYASREQRRLNHSPYVLAMISFMISSVPAPIRARRASRHARSTGNSRM